MKKILVLTDFSKRAEHAAELALRLAEKTNSEILIYNAFYVPEVIPAFTGVYPYYEDLSVIKKENFEKLEKFVQHLTKKVYGTADDVAKPRMSYFDEPGTIGRNIKNVLSTRRDISMIIMGDKNPKDSAIDRFFFGSDAHEVINKSNCPVLLVPEKAELKSIKTIALATNLEKTDYKALLTLIDFASFFNAKIIVAHVCPHKLSVDEKLKNMDFFNKMKGRINYHNISYEDLIGEEVGATLAKFARSEKLNILAVIHDKPTLLSSVFHNSTSEEMLDYHKVPLMVLPRSG